MAALTDEERTLESYGVRELMTIRVRDLGRLSAIVS